VYYISISNRGFNEVWLLQTNSLKLKLVSYTVTELFSNLLKFSFKILIFVYNMCVRGSIDTNKCPLMNYPPCTVTQNNKYIITVSQE
jgi:hypothetical protein